MRSLDATLTHIQPLARECVLHGVTVFPLGEEFGRDAAHFFSDLVWGQQLIAKVGLLLASCWSLAGLLLASCLGVFATRGVVLVRVLPTSALCAPMIPLGVRVFVCGWFAGLAGVQVHARDEKNRLVVCMAVAARACRSSHVAACAGVFCLFCHSSHPAFRLLRCVRYMLWV